MRHLRLLAVLLVCVFMTSTALALRATKAPYVENLAYVSWHEVNGVDCVWTQYETPSQDQFACEGQAIERYVTESPELKLLLIEDPIAAIKITPALRSKLLAGEFAHIAKLLLSGNYDLQSSQHEGSAALVGGALQHVAGVFLQKVRKITQQLARALGTSKRSADEIVEGMVDKGKELVCDPAVKRNRSPVRGEKPKPGQPKPDPDSPTYGTQPSGKEKIRIDPGHKDDLHPIGDPRREPHGHAYCDGKSYLITIECNGANLEMVTRLRKKKRPGAKKKGETGTSSIDDTHDIIDRKRIGSCENVPNTYGNQE